MNKTIIKEYLTEQISVLERKIKILNTLQENEDIKKFDKKVVNKKLCDIISNISNNLDDGRIYLRLKENQYDFEHVGKKKDIYINVNYNVKKESYRYKIEYEFVICNITNIEEKRFNYSCFENKIKNKIENTFNKIKCLKDELNNIETIIEEYEGIQKQIKNFNNKYSYEIRQDMPLRLY